jgi:mannose-6-phosphate isomerase-like protein (cupin superfamily)
MEQIFNKEQLLGIIVRKEYTDTGIRFFTPDEFSQQLAYMHHPAGKLIQPHVHNLFPRQVHYTLEVLVIKKGRLRVDFYDDDRQYLESRILGAGDLILLSSGGHGFEVLEELEMYEIKQGPYAGEQDKTRFDRNAEDQIKIGGE